MRNLPTTHPTNLKEMILCDYYTIYKNEKESVFTCFTIDKVLEQNLNKDTKSYVIGFLMMTFIDISRNYLFMSVIHCCANADPVDTDRSTD